MAIHDDKQKSEGETQDTRVEQPGCDATTLRVKHPLKFGWTLYYFKNDRKQEWSENMKEVMSFHYVEDFWGMYNNIQLASGIPMSSDYYFFKKDIKPEWEDKPNEKGGRWLISVDKNLRRQLLDKYWLNLMMAMIGEQFEDASDMICGAVVQARGKGDKVSLWTRDASAEDLNRKVGMIVKEKLEVKDKMFYEKHSDNKDKRSSTATHTMEL